MPHYIIPIDAERPSQAMEQSQFAPPRFHLSSSSTSSRLDASSSPPAQADSSYNLTHYNSSNASSPAISSNLSSRPTTSSGPTVLQALAADLSRFQIPDDHHSFVHHLPLASTSSLVFQPSPQPGVTAPQKKKTHSKPRPEGHVPRPRNPFIMFRMDVVEKKLITSENKHQNISKVVADMWKALSPKEKEPYLAAAKKEKEQHKIMYPNYVYQPLGEKFVEGGKSPKRVTGSKASLKAAALKEKKAMEEEQRRARMERHEQEEDDDDAAYVSSSTSRSKKRARSSIKKSRPKTTRPVSSSSNSYSDRSFEDEDTDLYPDARSHPVIPIRSSSSRGGHGEHSSGVSSSSFSSQGNRWESSNDEGTDYQRMGMSDRGLRVGYSTGGRGYGGAEGREEEDGDEVEPSLRHYQQTQQQPTYSYPNQQQQHYQPDNGQLTYNTYSDYQMPSQLSSSSSFPNSSIQTPSLIPFNSQVSRPSVFQRPHSGGAEFLPTAAPSPLTPGFPNLPTPGLQGHRRGSSLSSSMRYGLDDGLTPRTRAFWESAPLDVGSSSSGPPARTRGHRGGASVELSELFTREPLQSPRARESASRSQLRGESWHIGSETAFIHPPTANGVDYSSQHLVPYNQQPLPPRPSTNPSYSSHEFNPASIHEIPSPPPSDQLYPSKSYYPTLGSASLNLSTRRKARPQALSLLSKGRPQTAPASSLSSISISNTQSSGFSLEEQTPTQASFDGQDASYAVNQPYDDQSYGLVGMDQSGGYQGGQGQGPLSGNSMVFDDEWRPKVDYIPFVEAPWFIQ